MYESNSSGTATIGTGETMSVSELLANALSNTEQIDRALERLLPSQMPRSDAERPAGLTGAAAALNAHTGWLLERINSLEARMGGSI